MTFLDFISKLKEIKKYSGGKLMRDMSANIYEKIYIFSTHSVGIIN